jgi:thioredoxin 1
MPQEWKPVFIWYLTTTTTMTTSLLTLRFFFLNFERCGPCRFIAPVFEKKAADMPDVEFVKVDVDNAEEIAGLCGIQAMPTFQVFKGGAKVDEMRGASQDGLAQLVAKHK